MIKRILKCLQMSWHQFRRIVDRKPDPQEYAQKQGTLEVLKQLDEAGELELYYLDETGFSLMPAIPYGWQPIGETQGIPSHRSQRLNVLGLMHRQGSLESYVSEQSINSDVVIACIEAFFPKVDQLTVIVMDQASIHTSQAIQDKLYEWKERNIHIFKLPRSLPELNLIEILWRFMKYEWMDFSAYESCPSLVAHVKNMLRGFGQEFVINFA